MHTTRLRHWSWRPPIAAAMVLALSACANLPDLAGPDYVDLPPAALPAYAPGDTFVYQDTTGKQRMRQVASVRGEAVDWVTEEDYRFSTSQNFLLPPLAWDGPSSAGRIQNRVDPDTLWPMEPSKTATVAAKYQRLDKKAGESSTYNEVWSCKTNRPRTVVVPAGAFDAFKVICRRVENGKTTRTHIWYYAPEVGHFVKRIKKYGSRPDQVVELVSFTRTGRTTAELR